MLSGPFALALTAGMAATVNPCGFALLPAYLSAFVGLDERSNRGTAVARALAVSTVLTAGFVTVFGLFGLVVTPLSIHIERYLPWATIVIGLALVVLGILMALGRQFTVDLPKLQRGGADGTLLSMYLFGVSYAVASLSCTIGPFLTVTTSTFESENYASGVAVFVMYGIGMGVVVSVLTVAVALAKDGVARSLRSWMPRINRAAGVLLALAGAYVAYYGWYEVRLFFLDSDGDDPIVDAAFEVQRRLVGFVPDRSDAWKYALGAVVLVAAALAWSVHRRRRSEEPPGERPDVAEPVGADIS